MEELLDLLEEEPTGLFLKEEVKRGGTGAILHSVTDGSGKELACYFKEWVEWSGANRAKLRSHLPKFARYVRGPLATLYPDPAARMPSFFTHFARRPNPNTGLGVGVVVPKMPGVEFSRFNFAALTLAQKLHLALDLSLGLSVLHLYQIVHADLNEKNIMVDSTDPAQPRAYIIDFDGAGVITTHPKPRFRNYLRPLVRGTRMGAYMAPEVQKNSRHNSSPQTDRWDLAVALHVILFRGQDPLHQLPLNPAERLDFPHIWPHWVDDAVTTRGRLARLHQECYTALSPRLQRRFVSVFSRPVDAIFDPAARPTAEEWARDLFEARMNVARCPNVGCGRDYVAPGLTGCPWCNPEPPPSPWVFEAVD